MFRHFLFILSLLLCTSAFSGERAVDLFNPNKQTPNAIIKDNITKPNTFNKSNNLLRKAGSFKKATGDLLYIKGKVVDAFGVPIHNAVVKIWQANSAGKYHSTIGKKRNAHRDPSFIMSGESITDNLGNYNFITVFPGFYSNRAPHVNVIVIHEKFGMIETEMYFENHTRNEKDPQYNAYPKEDIEMLTAKTYYVDDKDLTKGIIAEFNIVLDGIHDYKSY